MLKIYGSDLSGPANKVRFTANALGLKYEYKFVDLRAGEHQKPEFLKLHPAGKVPVIDDDGFVLFESNAIIKYLAGKNNSPLYPKEFKQHVIVDQWMDFTSHHVGAALSKVLYNRIFAPMRGVPVDENSLKEGLAFLDRFLPVVDNQLAKNKYIAGNELTIADISILATLDPLEMIQVNVASFKELSTWRNNLKNQAFYKKANQEHQKFVQSMMAAK